MGDAMNAVVHVIDDDASLRTALSRLLMLSGYDVRQYAGAGDYLISTPDERPGCLLLDLHMPGGSGLALQDALKWHPRYAKPVIFLTGHGDVPSSVRAIKSGACDFLTKPVDRTALLSAVALALERDSAARARQERRIDVQRHYAELSARERVVLGGVIAGKLNKQIAHELGVTERTVKGDRSRAFHLFGVRTLSELVPLIADLELPLELQPGHGHL